MSLPCEIPRRLRKNYRLHDQVTVSLDSSVTIDCCQDWIATQVTGVTDDCAGHAKDYCDVGDRGGLGDAAWDRCNPN
jgi:hypothetical protein